MALQINIKVYEETILDVLNEIVKFQADIQFNLVHDFHEAMIIVRHNEACAESFPDKVVISGHCNTQSTEFTTMTFQESRSHIDYCVCKLSRAPTILESSPRVSANNSCLYPFPILNKMVWEIVNFARDEAKMNFDLFKGFPICLTFDVDHLSASLRYRTSRFASLFFHGQMFQLRNWRVTGRYARGRKFQHHNTLTVLEKLGIKTTWFIFMRSWQNSIGFEGLINPIYWPEDVKDLLRQIESGGHEIALHASPKAARSGEQMLLEKSQLERLIKGTVEGVRVHSGKHKGETYFVTASLLFRYDSSELSNRGNGFLFGFAGNLTQYGIVRIPSHWMDTAITNFKIDSWKESFAELANFMRECSIVRAPLIVILHNKPSNEYSLEFLHEFIELACRADGQFKTLSEFIAQHKPTQIK
jgi:peptidoglycan/xylan/chitin deacetylase (PgdA/CDA1 family)